MLAVVTLGGMLQFSIFRDLERSTIIWLHSRRHMSDDLNKLWHHLDDGPFRAVAGPSGRSIATVSSGTASMSRMKASMPSVSSRSTSGAKRRRYCVVSGLGTTTRRHAVLGNDDMKLLKDLETSHDRKTELAMTILKMVDEVQAHQGGRTRRRVLGAMLKVLADTPHVDRDSVAAAEARAKIIVSSSVEDLTKKQLRLTGEQLRVRISQIEKYFEVEYQIMLQQVSLLAARSVVLSGDKANDRLEELKAAGIGGLGSIQQFSFDRVLWMFLVVSLGGFLVLYLGYSRTMTPGMAEGLARFAFAMAIAALIGAIVGSRRRHSNSVQTPWLKYLTGGILAGVIFIGVSVLSNAIKVAMKIPQPEGQPAVFGLIGCCPGRLLPCIISIAIARLARIPHWPEVQRIASFSWLYVRTIDGVCVSLALFVAYAMAFSLHRPDGT